MTSRSVAYETARLRLSRYRLEGSEGRLRAAMHATQVSADALGADRVGVWLLGGRRAALECLIRYDRATGTHGPAAALDLSLGPAYVAALEARRVLAVEDVLSHRATRELAPGQLAPAGIAALLDAPILRNGRVNGIVRHEQLGTTRSWSQRDVDFASSVADVIALIFEQSERLELEAALQDQAEQRQESQKMEALGRMASAIAHDFNNVLGAMSMTAELATAEPADLPALIARMNQIIATGQRLSDQLLAFAKERPDGATGSCDLRAVVEGLLPMLRTATGARATLVFEPSAAARVPIDVSQAEQVLLNLVLNARDAIAERGTIRIVVRDATPEDEGPPRAIVLAVIDDGAGMDEATRSRVLEPYFTTKAYGSGLGLSIVFGIVRRAGGSVRVASAPGAGTTVTLVVPRHQPAQ